jgi:hypothetical protein
MALGCRELGNGVVARVVLVLTRDTQMDKVREGQLGWAWGRLSDGDDMEYRGWYGRCTGGV